MSSRLTDHSKGPARHLTSSQLVTKEQQATASALTRPFVQRDKLTGVKHQSNA